MHHIKQSIARTWQEHKLFILFLCGYTFVWGVLPSIFFSSIFPDSAQNIAWGNVLSWGYNQHPPLGAAFLHLVLKVVRQREVAVYLSSMLCFTVSYWYVFKIAREFMSRDSAIAAVVISSLCIFSIINFALQYNQNTILLPFWVMSCYYFWQAMRNNKLSSWLILAVVTVCAILAKYEAGIIIILLAAYLLKNFQKKYLLHVLIAAAVTLVLLIPHIHWLITTGFLPIHHVLDSTGIIVKKSWHDHIYNTVSMLRLIAKILVPVILLVLLCRLRIFQARSLSIADFKKKYFLPYLGFAPFLFVIAIPILSGVNILGQWCFPILVFTIPALFYLFDISVNHETLKKLIGSVLIAHLIIFFLFSVISASQSVMHGNNIPSYQLANTANNYWQRYEKDIPIQTVGGSYGMGYYLAAYLPSRPQFIAHLSLQQSPWINKQILQKYPALFAQLGCSNALANQVASEQFQVKHQTCVSVNLTNKFEAQAIEITLVIAQYNG